MSSWREAGALRSTSAADWPETVEGERAMPSHYEVHLDQVFGNHDIHVASVPGTLEDAHDLASELHQPDAGTWAFVTGPDGEPVGEVWW